MIEPVSHQGLPTAKDSVALVGAGSIGVAWAVTFARGGRTVALYDIDPTRLDAGIQEVHTILGMLETYGLIAESAITVAERVTGVVDLVSAVANAAHVQESGPEQLDVKRELFATLDAVTDLTATIASSSSAIAISRVASDLPGRGRMLVAHPANPPYLLPVIELVPAPWTELAAVEQARQLFAEVGMSPVVLGREVEGFALNRLQGALLREAYCLVRVGVLDVDGLDRCVREGLGRRWALNGPFETSDLNTRGGLARHAKIMGPAYQRMGAERGQRDPWTPDLVDEIVRQRRRELPLDQWANRVAWRDRALMQLEVARRQIPPFDLDAPGRATRAGHTALTSASEPVAVPTAERVALEHFGLRSVATRLIGERDEIFRIDAAGGATYVLKIAHASEDATITNLVTSAMLHIATAAPDMPVERLVPTVDGSYEAQVQTGGGVRMARLSTFLPGRIVRAVDVGPALRREIGRTLARLHEALRDFRHPAAHREIQWDIQHAGQLRPLLQGLGANVAGQQIAALLDRFDAIVAPQLRALPGQCIHNDFGSDNLLIDDQAVRVLGIIDFGDMAWSARANDVAVAAAYQLSQGDDPVAGALDVLTGYHAVAPLEPVELDIMGDLIRTRMAIRIVIPEWRAVRFPENRDYILRNTARSHVQLERLARIPPDEVTARIVRACAEGDACG